MKNKIVLLLLIILFFISCDLTSNNQDNEVDVDIREVSSPIDFEFELTGDTYDLEYLDLIDLKVMMTNNADKVIDVNYQIGYNYLILKDEQKSNIGTHSLKESEIYYDFFPFQVDSLDYNLGEINLDYYYCYNYNYTYDLYLNMYDEKGEFISNNLIDHGLNDIISDVIIDRVEVKHSNEEYFIYIYLNENNEYNQVLALSATNRCEYDYNDKNKLYYLVNIEDQILDCNYNADLDVEGKKVALINDGQSKITCRYHNPDKMSLNLDIYLEYAILGEFKNRLGVKIE